MQELEIDRLLSEENVSTLNKILNIFSEVENKYGLLSLIEGLASDEDTIGKVINKVVTDNNLQLLQRLDNVTKLVDLFTQDDTIETLTQTLDILKVLNKSGILDPIKGLLQDEETLTKIMSAVVSDNTLNLLSNWNNVMKLMQTVTNEEVVDTINELLGFYNKLKSLGIMDVLKGILEDEETMSKIMSGLVNDLTLNLLAHWGQIATDLGRIDFTNFKYYTLLVNETGEALKQEKIERIKHVWQLLGLFKDPEIQVGLGVVVAVLRHIGKYHLKYVAEQNTS